MIPFVCPQDHTIINLNQVVRIIEHPASENQLASAASNAKSKWIEVIMSNGETLVFEGKPAEIVLSQTMVCLQHFQTMLAQILAAQKQANGNIIIPNLVPPPQGGH